ncbi:MAG TPA: hypothetical protein VNG32_03450 [Candidatus Dormibacteraeota bacterium]|nr:hypothetical protein [Candidatus Dormibacteraeota bacterium]
MALLYSLFFGGGVAAFAYTKLGRRAGYGNTQNVMTIVGVIFVLTTLVFLIILTTLLHI